MRLFYLLVALFSGIASFAQITENKGITSTDESVNAVQRAFFRKNFRDFSKLAAFSGTPLNQLIVSLSDQSVEVNTLFGPKDYRPLVRVGLHGKAALAEDFAPLFKEQALGTDLEVGGRIYFDLYSPAFTKYSRQFFKKTDNAKIAFIRQRAANEVIRQWKSIQAQKVMVNSQRPSSPAKGSFDDLDYAKDSLQKLEDDFDEYKMKTLVAAEDEIEWSTRRYFWAFLEGNLTSSRANVYVPAQLKGESRNIAGQNLSVTLNSTSVYNAARFGAWGIWGRYSVKWNNSVFDQKRLRTSTMVAGSDSDGNPITLLETDEVLTGNNKEAVLHTVYLQALALSKKRDWGLEAHVEHTYNALKEQHQTVPGIGVIIPTLNDDEGNSRTNLVIFLNLTDFFNRGDNANYPTRWSRRVVGLKVGLPFALPK